MQSPRPLPHLRWLFWIWLTVNLCLLLAILWAVPFNTFVLAPDYLKTNQLWILPTAITLGAFGAWINMVAGFLKQGKLLAASNGFIVSALLTYFTLAHAYPMLWTQKYGKQGELLFTVENPQAKSRKDCETGRITLVGGPDLMRSEICNVPDSLRSSLTAGDTLRVLGHASELGVYYDDFQRVNNP